MKIRSVQSLLRIDTFFPPPLYFYFSFTSSLPFLFPSPAVRASRVYFSLSLSLSLSLSRIEAAFGSSVSYFLLADAEGISSHVSRVLSTTYSRPLFTSRFVTGKRHVGNREFLSHCTAEVISILYIQSNSASLSECLSLRAGTFPNVVCVTSRVIPRPRFRHYDIVHRQKSDDAAVILLLTSSYDIF